MVSVRVSVDSVSVRDKVTVRVCASWRRPSQARRRRATVDTWR